MPRQLTLFESATARGRVLKQGQVTQIVIDGGGAMVMETMEFIVASKWASSKTATGNILTDRGRFLEKISVIISRPGSLAGTRGSDKQLRSLARLMKQAGYDLGEWNLPPEIRNDELSPEDAAMEKAKEAKKVNDAHDAANAEDVIRGVEADMDDPYAGMKKK